MGYRGRRNCNDSYIYDANDEGEDDDDEDDDGKERRFLERGFIHAGNVSYADKNIIYQTKIAFQSSAQLTEIT